LPYASTGEAVGSLQIDGWSTDAIVWAAPHIASGDSKLTFMARKVPAVSAAVKINVSTTDVPSGTQQTLIGSINYPVSA
jgi:hypothetical protein